MSDEEYYQDGVHDPGHGWGKGKKVKEPRIPGAIVKIALAFILGAGVGAAAKPAPDFNFHAYAEGLARTEHCMPQIDWAVDLDKAKVEASTDGAVLILADDGMKHVEGSVIPIEFAGKTYYFSILTWENCAK